MWNTMHLDIENQAAEQNNLTQTKTLQLTSECFCFVIYSMQVKTDS